VSWLLALASFGYAVASTFGAWTVVHRHRGLAFTFLGAAAILTVGGVVVAYRMPESWMFLAAGSAAGSFASLWNARRVLRRVVVRNHVARALGGLALTLLAAWRF
jgi:hypothetical protein